MSDISLNISWFDLIVLAPIVGWPGLLIGAALGALAWRKRRIAGAIIGGLLGSILWLFAAIFLN